MEAKQYMRHLVEQCTMQFFVAVKVRESGQLFLKVYYTKMGSLLILPHFIL